MLSKCVSVNSRITQVVRQRIPHQRTNCRESRLGRWCLAGNVEWPGVVGWQIEVVAMMRRWRSDGRIHLLLLPMMMMMIIALSCLCQLNILNSLSVSRDDLVNIRRYVHTYISGNYHELWPSCRWNIWTRRQSLVSRLDFFCFDCVKYNIIVLPCICVCLSWKCRDERRVYQEDLVKFWNLKLEIYTPRKYLSQTRVLEFVENCWNSDLQFMEFRFFFR